MLKFDLQKVLDDFLLDPRVVAETLFPNNRYKLQALKRIIRDNVPLDLQQLDNLAKIIGINAPALLSYGQWQGTVKNNEALLIKGPYIVSLRPNGCFLKIRGEANDQYIAGPNIGIFELIQIVNKFLETWNQLKFKSI